MKNVDDNCTGYHYSVLYTTVMMQSRLLMTVKKHLSEKRGIAFSPLMESYRRDGEKTLELKPVFPGYVFIRSDLNTDEMHELMAAVKTDFKRYVRELGTTEYKDLSDEEARYMDLLLDLDRSGGEIAPDVIRYMFDRDEDIGVAAMMPRDDTDPDDESATLIDADTSGILRMSYGYRDHGKWIVMKGPLRAFQDHIRDVNKHNKKAYLDISIGGRLVRAGFDVKPRKYWFPDDKEAPEVLSDGSEFDLEGLVRSMTTLKNDTKASKKKKWTEVRSRK